MPNKYDVLTGEIENTSAVATFDELQEWYNSTKEGRTLWKGGDLEKWSNGFIKFYQDYGFTPTAGNSLFVRSDVADSNRLFINQSTNQNIVNEYGTVPSVPTWNTGAVTGQLGQLNISLNGGCKVAQQLITASTDSATGEFTTATVGGTAVGTLTLGDILLGSALGIGLGVAFTQFFPDQATDFSNFMLSPLINAGLLESASYEETRVGLMGVFKENNDLQANKFILPYAPYESVEKGLQYLLKIGAFVQVNNIDINIPNVGSIATFNVLNRSDILTAFTDLINANFFPNWFTLDDANSMIDFCENKGYITYSEDIVTSYTFQGGDKVGFLQRTSPKEKFTGNIVYVDKYKTGKGNGAELKGALSDTSWYTASGCYIYNADKEISNYGSLNHTSTNKTDWLYCGLGTLNGDSWYLGGINTTFEKGDNKVKGLQFTDYTPLIKDVNDLTSRLQEWKNKNGWKVNVPSYDEKGKPNGIREQWYLPLPTPSPTQKESGEYVTPTQPYWDTPVTPDSTPDIKKEIADKTKDLTDVLPENPEYNPKPTPPDDNTGTIEDSTLILGNNGQGLWSVYNPSLAQINDFGAWLWSNNIWEQIRQYFSDPMQGIIGLHKIYCKPTNGETKTIIAGYLDSGINSPIVTKQYERIDCGTMACAEYYGNALDYAPYTTVHLYLPFIGIVPLNVNEVMGSILHIFYDVDILTGACLATIEVKDSADVNISLYQYNGICSVQIPLTSGNYGSVISSLVTTGAGIVATVASGGALTPVALSGAVSALNSGAEIKQSGTIGANVGAMARKKPYMVITRKIPHMPLNYNGLVGFPSNNRAYLSELSGFVRTKKVYVSSLIATQNEKNMIEEILSDGVYI